MKLQISDGVKKFLVIFSFFFLISLFWVMFLIYANFERELISWLVGLFVLVCLGKLYPKLYDKGPATVIKLSLLIFFVLFVGYLWYDAGIKEPHLTGWSDSRDVVISQLGTLVIYTVAFFKTVVAFCVAMLALRCFEIGGDK